MASVEKPKDSPLSNAAEKRHHMFSTSIHRLASLAHKAIHERGLHPEAIVMVCIQVDSRWRPLVDHLMPKYNWQSIRDVGQEPIARGTVTRQILDFVAQEFPDMKDKIYEKPRQGHVTAIALDEGGLTIYEIQPNAEAGTI